MTSIMAIQLYIVGSAAAVMLVLAAVVIDVFDVHMSAHKTNDNFRQAMSLFMFQGESTINLNSLFQTLPPLF